MNRRQKIIISVTGIFLVLLILVGLTYAYFLTQIQGNEEEKSITVTTANLRLVYDNGDGTVITGDKIEPGYPLVPKTFTVTNEGNANITYGVYLIDVINTFERKEDITYTLTCKNEDNTDCNNVTESVTFPSGIAEMVQNEIEPNKTQTYTLAVTYKETGTDQSVDMNKTLQAKVQIFGENSKGVILPYATNTLAYNIVNSAMTVTEEEKANFYAEYKSTPNTLVAEQMSETIQEQGYEDDEIFELDVSNTHQSYYWTYSTSYSIDQTTGKFSLNNAKTCLYSETGCISDLIKDDEPIYIIDESNAYNNASSSDTLKPHTNKTNIFRVVEAPSSTTSTIKLKLKIVTNMPESTLSVTEDDYGNSYYYRGEIKNNYLNFNNMCWRIVRIEGDGAIKLVLSDSTSNCNENLINKRSSAFIGKGYYGTTVNAYGQYIANYERGSLKATLNNWINNFSDDIKQKIKTVSICNGDIAYTNEGNLMSEEEKENALKNSVEFRYDSYVRLNGIGQQINPTLKCIGTRLIESKVFPLTLDEIIFAGMRVSSSFDNYSFYLRDNALTDNWFTITMGWFNINLSPNYDIAWGIRASGSKVNAGVNNANYSIRPAISLLPNTQIDGGDGTITNPYTIK